jgi:secondary thiamine-phosphate synthase enzyme
MPERVAGVAGRADGRSGRVDPIRQELHEFVVHTRGRNLYEVTDDVVRWVRETGIGEGLLTLHVRHTSASLVIQENADPEVQRDLERFFTRLVPPGDPIFRHTSEGPDDMPAHVRTALTATSLSVPVSRGVPALGTWQGIYLFEHRDRGHRRRVAAQLMGE